MEVGCKATRIFYSGWIEYIKYIINAPTCFDLIREPTVCASLKLQYWCQLKYFVIELFGRVPVY